MYVIMTPFFLCSVFRFCEEVVKVLGLDWVLLFAQGHLHPSTVLIALRMLVALLSNASILQKFRDATHNGGWMTDAQQVTSNKSGQFLGECSLGLYDILVYGNPAVTPSLCCRVKTEKKVRCFNVLLCSQVFAVDNHDELLCRLLTGSVVSDVC